MNKIDITISGRRDHSRIITNLMAAIVVLLMVLSLGVYVAVLLEVI